MKIISLATLPDNFGVGLNKEYRKAIFKASIQKVGMNDLAKKLGYARKTVEGLRRGYTSGKNRKRANRFLRIRTVKKLAQIATIDIEKIESHITGISFGNSFLKINLPIYTTKKLSSVIGHCFGDGYVGAYFGYFNKNKRLINEVRENVRNLFNLQGNVIRHHGTYFLYFPGIISKILNLVGAPFGNKMQQKLQIPLWIKRGNKKIKSSFLRALFDDESSVKFRRYDRSIQFALFKEKRFLRQHKIFMKELCELLLELQIMPSKLRIIKTKNSIGIRFTISGYHNLISFLNLINFSHPFKRQKLENSIKTYKQIQYHDREKFSNQKWIAPGIKIVKK